MGKQLEQLGDDVERSHDGRELGLLDQAGHGGPISPIPKRRRPVPKRPRDAADSSSFVADRFRILRPHARGGLGEVFVALDRELGREVAIKQIRSPFADDDSEPRPLRPRGRGHRRSGTPWHRTRLRVGLGFPGSTVLRHAVHSR